MRRMLENKFSVLSTPSVLKFHDRKAFVPIHPPGTLSMLPPEAHIGPIDPATLPKAAAEQSEEEKRLTKARANLPPPEAALNLADIAVSLFPTTSGLAYF